MIKELSNDQQRTYDTVFQHPISSNLERRDVRSLFEALGEVTEEHNGNLKIERNGHTLVLHPSHTTHPAAYDEVMLIRHFLEASGTEKVTGNSNPVHMLVVVEHSQISVYRSETVGSTPERFVPHATHKCPRHVSHLQERDGDQSRPLDAEFFKTVADSLGDAAEILVFGTGAEGKKIMEDFLVELRINHNDTFGRVVGSHIVGGKDLTEEMLLEKARDFYALRDSREQHTIAGA